MFIDVHAENQLKASTQSRDAWVLPCAKELSGRKLVFSLKIMPWNYFLIWL